MNRLFDIVTLSDKHRSINYSSLADPVSVILGGAQVIGQILPNFMGASRTTAADFVKLFPGNGYYTNLFRDFLLSKIKYQKDIPRDLPMYTVEFVANNNEGICPGTYTFQQIPGTNPGGAAHGGWQPCINKFYDILRREATGAGTQVYPMSGFNWQELLPYALGGAALFLLLQTKKKRR